MLAELVILNRSWIAGLVVFDLKAKKIVNGGNALWRTGFDLDAAAISQWFGFNHGLLVRSGRTFANAAAVD